MLAACFGMTIVPQTVQAQGRQVDMVHYFGTYYDAECLYRLANANRGLPDADYLVLMDQECLWNGVENPPSPGLPVKTIDSIDCTSVTCLRFY